MDHQENFLYNLTGQFSSRQAMVEAVANLLNLSKDAVYRRLRGATVLSTNEFHDICIAYDLRPFQRQSDVSFTYNRTNRDIRSPADYLLQLTEHLDVIQRMNVKELYIANPGLPFFHEMLHPRLFAFKLYVYGSTCWDFPGWRDLKFSLDLIDDKVLQQARSIGRFAYRIPGKELWTMGMLHATIDQIEFMEMSGRFANPDEANLLLNDLRATIDHLEYMARHGRKFLPGEDPDRSTIPFEPAHNELANNDNLVVVSSPASSLVFVAFITPNFLVTDDEAVHQLAADWLENVIEQSTSLGAGAGKYRSWYFRRLQDQITAARDRLGGYRL